VAALSAVIPPLAASARTAGIRGVAVGRWLADVVTDLAPHVPARNARTLRQQFPGLSDEAVADALILSASRLTAGVGAAAGALATAEFAAPPALLAAPVQLAAETLVVVSVELKLVAELHEIAGRPALGSASDRAGSYLTAWVQRRAIGPAGSGGVRGLLGETAKRELRMRLLRRVGRSTTSLAPFMAGAVAGAEVNRRSTRELGARLRADLFDAPRQRPHADIEIDVETTTGHRSPPPQLPSTEG
jgi:hypothetical protein